MIFAFGFETAQDTAIVRDLVWVPGDKFSERVVAGRGRAIRPLLHLEPCFETNEHIFNNSQVSPGKKTVTQSKH